MSRTLLFRPGWLLVLLATLMVGCVSGRAPDGYVAESAVVLGVVSSARDLSGFRAKLLANGLEAQIRTQQPEMAILPHNMLTRTMPSSDHRLLLARYRQNGRLTAEDWESLRGLAGRVRYVVIVSIDRDELTKYKPVQMVYRNSIGQPVPDRSTVELKHERIVDVTAHTYDASSGRLIWSGRFSSRPANRRVYTAYSGSSFAGALANSLTNTFVNGRGSQQYPPAPSSEEAIQEAFKRIAQEMTGRPRR